MADIKQAAQWMQEGKRVKRPHDVLPLHAEPGTLPTSKDDCDSLLSLADLLAEDWEVAP